MQKKKNAFDERTVKQLCVEYDVKLELIRELINYGALLKGLQREASNNYMQSQRREAELHEAMRDRADYLLEKMAAQMSGNDVWKFFVRTIEPKSLRKVLNQCLRKRKEEVVVTAIESRSITWDGGIAEAALPYGTGLDERVIELPLAVELAAFERGGWILDAGCSLNLEYLRPWVASGAASITHFTQSGEREFCQFEGEKVSYQFGDLRDLPYRDGCFGRVLCISTLEHVGMDNSRYGGSAEQDFDAYQRALSEMYRVVRPGGFLLVTVPYGVWQNHEWFQTYGPNEVESMARQLEGAQLDARYFVYEGAWRNYDGSLSDVSWRDTEMVQSVALLKFNKGS